MNEAIKLAIEKGGYNPVPEKIKRWEIQEGIQGIKIYVEDSVHYHRWFAEIILDPEFWKCLGKALGWITEETFCWEHEDNVKEGDTHINHGRMSAKYFFYWHRYIDWLDKGLDTEKFWKELINK